MSDGLLLTFQLSDALLRRFTIGTFEPGHDYNPDNASQVESITVPAARLTHRFGATFSAPDPNATVDMPLYRYGDGSDASDLIECDGELFNSLENDYQSLTYTEVHAAFQAAGGRGVGTNRPPSLPRLWTINFGAVRKVIGNADVVGTLTVQAELKDNPMRYRIGYPRIVMTIDDVYDFDYFDTGGLAGLLGYPHFAATVQCGYARGGVPSRVGQVAMVHIEIDQAFSSLTHFESLPFRELIAP